MASHKILVIDDSTVIRKHVKEMLPKGFEVIEAKDGVEGINLIRQAKPNFIMLDFILPKMSGFDIFNELKSDPKLQTIPLVLMSGRKEEVTAKIKEPFKYFAFIEKPFNKKQLTDAIKESMQKAKKRPATPAPAPVSAATAESSLESAQEIAQLKAKVAKMQQEIDALKKQLGQLVTFIKQKLK
ncbi:MAG: response regulator [Moorea sp. SIO3I7]|uniref:response regulator n=1 Tax=unclassified Moorena TaxID=2683338 RepID=UPI0013C111B6|nr:MULTISPECIES: response regulator [unclassified Moorena]NEN95266.1 response regulator [Moorena sp. SIO3I7]NEO04202.1 response regulator [Moorena sp. SIO3I8]NEO19243.1 response regulator [Moorena sp. SIO4A5]NEQ57941.1 response regulator [Moorena sp. SIO4A1]